MTEIGISLRQRMDGLEGRDLVDELFAFINEKGLSFYDEEVTQLEHGLQCATLARERAYGDRAVAAALLHDLGHLLLDEHEYQNNFLAEDLNHEEIGAEFLKAYFPEEITEPIRLHVAAKRYLCTTDSGYYDRLSNASKRSFQVQGGNLSEAERAEYEQNPHLDIALKLRQLDDLGKAPDQQTPPIEEFAEIVTSCLRSANG